MPAFVPGLELSRCFFEGAVRPILDQCFPHLTCAAAHIGTGSDVFGFDTEMSTDHDWGPSVRLLLRDEDAALADPIHESLRRHLPLVFRGYPVNVEAAPDDPHAKVMCATTEGPVNHRVFVATLRAFFWQCLAYDVDQPVEAADWLTFPSQTLLEVSAGAVHHDRVGQLTELRERLRYYPRDVWLYMLAAGWQRIGQEEHLMPRAGYVGDELGSALIGSRLVRDVMSLCFLMERRYAPYPKWFGTAFKQLRCAEGLSPVLWRAQRAQDWREREGALCQAYEYLARMHNALGITEVMHETVSDFYHRPFAVIHGERFVEAIRAQIAVPEVRRIMSRDPIGSIDQISDNTDVRSDPSLRRILRQLYV